MFMLAMTQVSSTETSYLIQTVLEKIWFLGCGAMYFKESLTFLQNIPHPCSGLRRNPNKKPAEVDDKLGSARTPPSCLAYSLILKMEVICSSETLGLLRTRWHCNPEDYTL
jgi:hypothetical protein